jgi:hypothetical protein
LIKTTVSSISRSRQAAIFCEVNEQPVCYIDQCL